MKSSPGLKYPRVKTLIMTNTQSTNRSVELIGAKIQFHSEIAIAKTTHPRYNTDLFGRLAQLVRALR